VARIGVRHTITKAGLWAVFKDVCPEPKLMRVDSVIDGTLPEQFVWPLAHGPGNLLFIYLASYLFIGPPGKSHTYIRI